MNGQTTRYLSNFVQSQHAKLWLVVVCSLQAGRSFSCGPCRWFAWKLLPWQGRFRLWCMPQKDLCLCRGRMQWLRGCESPTLVDAQQNKKISHGQGTQNSQLVVFSLSMWTFWTPNSENQTRDKKKTLQNVNHARLDRTFCLWEATVSLPGHHTWPIQKLAFGV